MLDGPHGDDCGVALTLTRLGSPPLKALEQGGEHNARLEQSQVLAQAVAWPLRAGTAQ